VRVDDLQGGTEDLLAGELGQRTSAADPAAIDVFGSGADDWLVDERVSRRAWFRSRAGTIFAAGR